MLNLFSPQEDSVTTETQKRAGRDVGSGDVLGRGGLWVPREGTWEKQVGFVQGARRAHGGRPCWAPRTHACPSSRDPLGPAVPEGPTQDGPGTHPLRGEGVSTSVWKTPARCAVRNWSRVFPELCDVRIPDFAPETLSLTGRWKTTGGVGIEAGKRTCGFPGGPVVNDLPAGAGDGGSIPGPERRHVARTAEP